MEYLFALLERKRRDHPVLMLTALGAIDDKVVGLNAGADDYLAKPFAFKELLARIQATLATTKRILASHPCHRKISVSIREAESLPYKNKPVSLTLKEFMILEYLMRNVGKVVTRERTLFSRLGFCRFVF